MIINLISGIGVTNFLEIRGKKKKFTLFVLLWDRFNKGIAFLSFKKEFEESRNFFGVNWFRDDGKLKIHYSLLFFPWRRFDF